MSYEQAIGHAEDARQLNQAEMEEDGPEAFENDEPIIDIHILTEKASRS